jgi:hypothetical protein
MSTQTVYFDNPADIVALQTTTATQTSQITSMSGSISTLNTTTATQTSRINAMSGSLSTVASTQIGYTYLMPQAGQAFDQIEVDPFKLIEMYDNFKYAYKLANTTGPISFSSYPAVLAYNSTGTPSNLTSATGVIDFAYVDAANSLNTSFFTYSSNTGGNFANTLTPNQSTQVATVQSTIKFVNTATSGTGSTVKAFIYKNGNFSTPIGSVQEQFSTDPSNPSQSIAIVSLNSNVIVPYNSYIQIGYQITDASIATSCKISQSDIEIITTQSVSTPYVDPCTTMYYMVPEGFPKATTLGFDDTGITYRSIRPVDVTGDEILYIWSGVVKIIWVVVFGFGYYYNFNNQFVTKLNYIDNETYGRNYLTSLGTIIKNNSTELANGSVTSSLSFDANSTAQLLANYGDFMLSLANTQASAPFTLYSNQQQHLTQTPNPIKFYEPRYYTAGQISGMLNILGTSVSVSSVNASLATTSQAYRPSASILKGIPYYLSLKIRQLMYLLKENNRQLADIPEQGVPPVREGSAGTTAPFTGAFGQAYVNGTGPATNLIARLRGLPDEDGNAMFTSTVLSSSVATMNTRPSYVGYLTAQTGASWDNYVTTSSNNAFNKAVLDAIIDGSYELTPSEKVELKTKLNDIFNNELLPLIKGLYTAYNNMTYVNGKAFYDDNYPSYWRTEIPGQILYMTGAKSGTGSITYKYDLTQPGNLGTGSAWNGMIVNMTGVSVSTINKLITESSSTMYSITGSTGVYFIPTSHPRVQKYQDYYNQTIACTTNSFVNNTLPLLYKEDTSIQYYQYTGYNNILQNYASTGINVTSVTDLEDIMTKIGVSQLSLFNDYTLYTAEKWIQDPLSLGYLGFGGATGVASLKNLPGYTGWGTTYCSALSSTPTLSEQAAWLNGYSAYTCRGNTLSDIDVLGYNYGWTGPAASMFVMTGAGFTVPSDATLASQRGSGSGAGRPLYDPTLPFDYIYRQHYPVRASDGAPVTTAGGSTPIASLPYSLQAIPAVNLTLFNTARALTYSMTGYYNPTYPTFVGSFHGMKKQYYMDRMANWLYNNPNSTYLSTGYINRYLLSDTPSGTGANYMATGPYGRPNKYLRYKITELDSGTNSAAVSNRLSVEGIIDCKILLVTGIPRTTDSQIVILHENILGHTLQFATTFIDVYLGDTQNYNWVANAATPSTTRNGNNVMQTVGVAVTTEGWATWSELTPLTISDQYFTLNKTGTLDSVRNYSDLYQQLNNSGRICARLMVDVGINSPRYAWSLGKAINKYYEFGGQAIPQANLYRFYTQMANQLTYGIGLNINTSCVSLLYNLLGDDFDPSLFFNQRTTFSEVTGPFLIQYVQDNQNYYRKSLASSSPFYIAP